MLDPAVMNKLKHTATYSDNNNDNSFLGRILLFGDTTKSSPVLVRSDTTMKNVDAVAGSERESFLQTMKDNKTIGFVNTERIDLKTSNTVALNRIALSKFLNDLREEVVVGDGVFGEIPTRDVAEGVEKRGKERPAKGILSKEFGKDGDKLKMKIIEEDVVSDVVAKRVLVGEEDGRRMKEAATPRKVSFKVNGSRRNKAVESRVVLNSSKVAALASKYNSLVDNVDTSKANDGTILIKTPHQKPDIKVVVSRKNSVILKRDASNPLKRGVLADDITVLTCKRTGSVNNRNNKTPVLKSRSGNVRAAIQIFEQNSTIIKVKTVLNKEEKTASTQDKENVKVSTLPEERTATKSLVPRFSTLYKDYNKEFKKKTEDDRNSSATTLKSARANGSAGDDLQTDVPVENKSVLHGERTKDDQCERLVGTTIDETKESRQQRQSVDDKTYEGAYEVVQRTTIATDVCKQQTITPGRKISKITKKVISFPTKARSKSSSLTETIRNESSVEVSDEVRCSVVEGVEDYESISVGGSPLTGTYERIPTTEKVEVLPPKVRPNSSFLWGAPAPRPLPSPHDDIEIPDIYAYDDVYPPGISDSLHYSSVNIEDIYDDIGEDAKEVGVQRSSSSVSTGTTYDVIGSLKTVPVVVTSHADGGEETASCRYDYVSRRPCDPPSYQDLEDNIYDDVKTLSMKEDTMSISNCYESIYEGVNGSTKEAVNSLYGGKEAVSSAGSSVSSKSFCEQNNSLYGGLLGPRFESCSGSQASTASVEDGPHEVLSYQLTSLGVTRSDTSDEWVDLEPSDSEPEPGTINLVVHERSRCRRSPSWSQKVRRQWSKSPPSYAGTTGGESSDDSDHHYEMLDDVVEKAVGGGVDPLPFDDFDSFDSDSSEDRAVRPKHPDGYNTRLPDPPAVQNIYGITKIAEAAGNKLLKLRKSLSKMRPKRHTTEIRLSSAGPPPLSAAPPLPPAPLEKTTSSGNLSNKKYWSLRKFKRSSSTVSQTASTFYITDAVDADTGRVEPDHKRNSVVSVSSDVSNGHDRTSPAGSKTCVDEIGAAENGGARRNPRPAAHERRASARPNSPPPLPPPPLPPAVNTESAPAPKRPNRKDKRSTSWYAECGLFEGSESNVSLTTEAKRNANKDRSASNSWYAEVGLWDEDNGSGRPDSLAHEPDFGNCAEASDSSASPENSGAERRFNDEPLYQFYTASIVELARRDSNGEFDSDGYEEIGEQGIKLSARPTAMELIQPREGLHRTLWCQIPEVISSRVLSTINAHQKRLQEAKFEIITSEASYIKSLDVLERHFISSAEFDDETVLSKSDRRILFSNVTPVKNCSKRFLAELEKCWQDNILLNGICDVIFKYATDNFSSYVKYCSNQIYRDRTLRRLKERHGKFGDALTRLETTPGCQSLSLHSFLMLPMQRITRLPLLVDAVLTRLDPHDDEYPNCKMALATLNKIVKDCNEGARRMERMEEILILSRQLDFPREIKAVPIISSTRWLVRSGELTQLVFRGDEAKLTFGKKFSKSTLHFFLFTDLLVITKKKSEECYVVTDYCPRNMVQMASGDNLAHLPVKFSADGGRNLVLLTMLQNHERKTVEMVLSCGVESDRQRWLQATSQPTSDNPDESVYEDWDRPQVTTVHPFTAGQPDELALDISDVVNVTRKTPDGWYHGERMRDGEQGWFPGNYTVEVASAHVRARNLKQRYRLLALSANYLDTQRKEKK